MIKILPKQKNLYKKNQGERTQGEQVLGQTGTRAKGPRFSLW